ncbi:hypothetical protein JCM10207_002086 [Rhodosporidiobolus poonsookiae]
MESAAPSTPPSSPPTALASEGTPSVASTRPSSPAPPSPAHSQHEPAHALEPSAQLTQSTLEQSAASLEADDPSSHLSTSASHGQHSALGGAANSPAGHWREYANAPELTDYLQASFVPSVVPQPEEYQAKEQARVFLEKLAEQVSPGARLLPFGSMANGFALKNSDMDLCCFLGKDAPVRSPSELVELLGRLIEQETNFYVKMLPRARIPIIKLTMPPTPAVPAGMACDIGFENRLALENTRLLLTYAMVDSRLRTLVLFLKVWTKRRKINNPYRGTLSSYGYVLLVIHFLAHVKQPPILPNLQRIPPANPSSLEELVYEGHDISFFDDLETLSSIFQTQNGDSAGELLIDFFRYFSKDFNYNHSVVSIRSESGTMQKLAKGWHTDFEFDPELIVRDQHKLCIEDPFQLDYNVARTVTRDGLYTIRGEFMRAFRILTTPARGPEGVGNVINSLCEEREDYLLIHPADSPYSHHQPHHPHVHTHNPYLPHPQHLQPQAPKSPRRRSAPSPRMGPQMYGQGLHHQPPTLSQSHGRADYPLWRAAEGNGAVLAPAAEIGGASRGGSRAGTPTPPSEAGGEHDERKVGPDEGAGLEALTPTGAGSAAHAPALHPPPLNGHQQAPLRPPSMGLGLTGTEGSSEAMLGAPPVLERRSSWDAGSEGKGKMPSPTPSAAGSASGGAYDLHRFFQNPASSSRSDVGGPTASSSSASSASASNSRTTVSLTAPSSPDMAASSAYFAGHPTAYGYPGRAAYRYSNPPPGAGYGSHVGPRLAASVPRNPHTAHHAYTNPYASAPVPSYALSSSASTTSSASYTTATSHLPGTGYATPSTTLSGSTAPAPIFPEEDRAAVALANQITFGNFPEMLPLPSYAQYHASGGSAAYLAGGGGWGTTPYGMSGSVRVGNRTHGPGGRRAGRRSDEHEFPYVPETARGRRLADLMEGEEPGRMLRSRGRSVPHVRMGPDGRETLLFGAIEVTLPKAEDVEEAEREEAEADEEARRVEQGGAAAEVVEAPAEEEKEVAFLGPSPPEDVLEAAPTTDEIPPRAVRSIPVLTTQPPTPAKTPQAAPPVPLPPLDVDTDSGDFSTAPTSPTRSTGFGERKSTPLSPLSAVFETAPSSARSGTFSDLDRTPRASSPQASSSVLPNGWTTLPPLSPLFPSFTPSSPKSPSSPTSPTSPSARRRRLSSSASAQSSASSKNGKGKQQGGKNPKSPKSPKPRSSQPPKEKENQLANGANKRRPSNPPPPPPVPTTAPTPDAAPKQDDPAKRSAKAEKRAKAQQRRRSSAASTATVASASGAPAVQKEQPPVATAEPQSSA